MLGSQEPGFLRVQQSRFMGNDVEEKAMHRALRLVFAILVLLPCLFAQFGSGIQGTILDSSGAVVPDVRVTVTNVETGVSRDVLTSDTGVFRVLSLGAGVYSVKAAKEG